jgi:hypothetical protein
LVVKGLKMVLLDILLDLLICVVLLPEVYFVDLVVMRHSSNSLGYGFKNKWLPSIFQLIMPNLIEFNSPLFIFTE